jgi:hypothetical protein
VLLLHAFNVCLLQVYGSYYRQLSKKAQAALAEANAVAEEVLSAQATVSHRFVGVALWLMRSRLLQLMTQPGR